MRIVYHLGTCSTCAKIIKELNLSKDFRQREIKTESISEQELEQMAKLAGSYEALFSRRAMKYKSMGLKDKQLGEQDYKQLILDEYTFLKRPVFIIDNEIFIGNAKKTVEAVAEKLANEQ
ncbi:arsenate reductase family protein [Luteibaculum oceani]|uniref:Arsenate reductase n=1 Tax=Luteibaculum oceani TaxID=1294296 RepID=A0A5C6VLB4_9FLAO|nr:ArsC/Spx/MgsR family protein [Luteibaculum oceani]TXC85206.1 hypothetical protein FRX97_00870 [Luteibaculum oceani]